MQQSFFVVLPPVRIDRPPLLLEIELTSCI